MVARESSWPDHKWEGASGVFHSVVASTAPLRMREVIVGVVAAGSLIATSLGLRSCWLDGLDDTIPPAADPGPPIKIARPHVDSANDPWGRTRRALCGGEAEQSIELPSWELRREFRDIDLDKLQRWAGPRPPSEDHDGAAFLIENGDETCIPRLMRVLARNRPAYPGGVAVCTYAHAREALVAIVGEDQGWAYEGWRNWYARYKRQNLEKMAKVRP
jgi:hypothetical protein